MKKSLLLISLLFILLANVSRGQELPKTSLHIDEAIGVSKNQFAFASSFYRMHGLGAKRKFKIGYGLRFTTYSGKDQDYVTAPAKLTSGKTGLTVIFTEDIPENFDTLNFYKANTNFINAALYLEYEIIKNFSAGFNIDLLGFSFGPERGARFTAKSQANSFSEYQLAKPTVFNLLLTSDNDKGSLNSEFYLQYFIKSFIGIRGGLAFIFSEYTTKRSLTFDNDRFRNKIAIPFLSINYKFKTH